MTPEQATAARVAAVVAERDAIQANLLELDGSFGKRALEGASLAGPTAERWEKASSTLAGLWETFLAYSAVVDRIAALGGPASGGGHHPHRKDLTELTDLLTGGCVQLPGAPVPLARRDLAAQGRPPVTLTTAVGTMRRAFAEVAAVTSAAEEVWAAVGPPLEAAASGLAAGRPLVTGLGPDIEAEFTAAESALGALRAAGNADPLALWHDGRTDTAAADRLREQVAELTPRIAELDRVRRESRQRIDALTARVAAARAARDDAMAAWQEASARIAALPPLPPGPAEPPLGGLAALASGGQWGRLAAELDRCTAELDRFSAQSAEAGRLAAAAVDKRDELRGLLRAYKAKAARLGAAEDTDLAGRHDQAYGLLWTAPCDLTAAEAAVAAYQRAILATEGRR
jgi:hypothetical protein